MRHILIPYIGATRAAADITATPEQARVQADSIAAVVKRNRSKFVDLLELSSDKVSNENEGVLEFAYNSAYAPEFRAFSFDNKVGAIDVVETSFGYHVIEILEQSKISATVKLATIAKAIEPSEETIDDVYNQVSKFEIALETGVFSDVAAEYEKNVKVAAFEELDENVPGFGSQRQIVRWAFDEETEVGDYKRFPISGVGFVMVQLRSVNPKGLMKVENATTPVLAEIRKEKKAEIIKSQISGSNLSDIASNQGQTVRSASAVSLSSTTLSGAGVEPKVVGAAFGIAEGAVSGPIVGTKGVYLVEVTKVNDADELDNYAAIASRLSNTLKAGVTTKVYNALQESAEIEDNRATTVY